MRLIVSTRFLWPFEGHQTFFCRLRIYQDGRRDVVVVSDEGERGEVDTSITHQLPLLYQSVQQRYGLGGPGRVLQWIECYTHGWQRDEPHPSGRRATPKQLWSRVVFIPIQVARERDQKLPERGQAIRWLRYSRVAVESLLGRDWDDQAVESLAPPPAPRIIEPVAPPPIA